MTLQAEAVAPVETNSPVSNAAILGQAIGELESLNHLTEREFLAMGGKLLGFIETANRISSELAAIANLVSGEQGAQAAAALARALDFSTGLQASIDHGNQLMANMRHEANRLKRTLSMFHGTASTFHSLGLLTRIETVRLGSAGSDFGNLAEDVRLLARNIQSRVENALDTAEELTPRIEAALREVSELQQGQAKELPVAISQVFANLSSFQELQKKSHAASIRLGVEYREIAEAFQRLIVSLQFHDITRQQIEHVNEVLARLCAEPRDGKSRLLERRGAAAVLELQAAQLADAREKFSASAAAVAESLADVSANVAKMLAEKSEMAGLADSEKDSSFHQMEQGCNAALASLDHCTKAQAATRATGGGLVAKISYVRESIQDIRKIELQMQQTAMNARISAVHLGMAGDALSTLADEIKRRAFESREGSDALVGTLDAMRELATRLSEHGGAAADGDCLPGMRAAVATLRSSHESGLQQIEQITVHGSGLCRELAAARAGFSVAETFVTAIARALARLKLVIEDTQTAAAGDGEPEIGLAAFATHYTMQGERAIYEAMRKTSAADAPATPGPGTFEDSVEFF